MTMSYLRRVNDPHSPTGGTAETSNAMRLATEEYTYTDYADGSQKKTTVAAYLQDWYGLSPASESEPAYTPGSVITDVNTIIHRAQRRYAGRVERRTREAQGLTKTRFYRTSDGVGILTTREAEEEFGPIGTVAGGWSGRVCRTRYAGSAARTQHSMGQWSIGIRENNQGGSSLAASRRVMARAGELGATEGALPDPLAFLLSDAGRAWVENNPGGGSIPSEVVPD